MPKKILIAAIVLIVLLIAAGIFYPGLFGGEKADILGFAGNVVNIEGDTITLRGSFEGPAGTIPEELLSEREFFFRVDNKTSFEKFIVHLPSMPELPENGIATGSYSFNDLQNEKGEGSIENMKSYFMRNEDNVPIYNIFIRADFPASINGSKNAIASSVFYQIFARPAEEIKELTTTNDQTLK